MRLRTLENRVFIALVLAVTVVFLWMVRAFLLPVFWAAVFAVLFHPLHRRVLRGVGGRRDIAALLTTLSVVVFVVVPFSLLVGALTRQAVRLYQRIATGEIDLNAPIAFFERSLPAVADILARYGIEVEQLRGMTQNAVGRVTEFIAGQALAIGQNALTVTVLFGLMLYLLYFFFRDGTRIIDSLVRAIPMGDERERRLMVKFAEVSRATVKGTLVVATVQGAIGGILFASVGIEAALFWGVVMGVLSLLPAVGASLVWVPAAIVLIVKGQIWQALVVIAGGSIVIGLVDNLLRPILIGRESKMPDYLILLATLGGLSVFGLAGFVAGPVIAALFLVMWDMFADEYAPLDTSAPPVGAVPAVVHETAHPPPVEVHSLPLEDESEDPPPEA
jgi:predicted PurR-regulated permease PerM